MNNQLITAARHVLEVAKTCGFKVTHGDEKGECLTRYVYREGVAVVLRINRTGSAYVTVRDAETGAALCSLGYYLPERLKDLVDDLDGLLKVLEPQRKTVH